MFTFFGKKKEGRELSNFYKGRVTVDGRHYSSGEHAFHGSKYIEISKVLSKRNKKKFLSSLVNGVKYWIQEIHKRKESIVFYYITTSGKYQKKNIDISEFLTAFQSVLNPIQFIGITDVYDGIKVGKTHEEEAFKKLMTTVNGNRFFKTRRNRRNTLLSSKSRRSMVNTKNSSSTRKRYPHSI